MKPKSQEKSLYLRIYPDSVLRQVCDPVETFDSWLDGVLEQMFVLMDTHNGIGLAGPQVGIPHRFFIAKIHRRAISLMNPVITSRIGFAGMTEGCLSLPNTVVYIDRNVWIDVTGYDFQGNKQTYQLHGLWARVVQHEIDHLNGVVISDYHH
ncbi:peptide deformylase [Planctomycetota bacterium]